MRTKIALFCSGSGSNAQKIMDYFKGSETVEVAILMANKADAFALERAKKMNIATRVFTKDDFYASDTIVNELKSLGVKWVVLAGFLLLIPETLIEHYPNKIINIHPALLPKYGGKGMYGMHVHRAVVANREKESGMTIHYVNKKYDEGEFIFQASCKIDEKDSPEEVAAKVLLLEHEHFPKVIEALITG